MNKLTRQVIFGQEARDKFLKGVNVVGDAVASTLGPRGNNVAINMPIGAPLVIHDGVTVSRSIDLEDPFEDMGAQLIKEAAEKTVSKVGDGTTLTTIIAQTLLNEGNKLIKEGTNPMVLKAQLEDSLKVILDKLKKLSKPIKTLEETKQVATISSADPELGDLIATAIDKVGKDGVVTVNMGNSFTTSVRYTQGMEIERGFLSPYFVTDSGRGEAVLENPYILLTDKKLNYDYDVSPIIERMLDQGQRNLLIVAGEVVEDALNTLVINKMRGVINVVAIQAPAWGIERSEELNDLATVVGGHVIEDDSGRDMKSVMIEDLGRADRVTVSRNKTVIEGGKGDEKAIMFQMENIREQMKIVETDHERVVRERRLAKMAGGVAVIEVGATTDVEMKDRKERVIDAVAATKAAIEEGIVAGGEITLLKIANEIDIATLRGVEAKSLTAPYKKLMENSGFKEYVIPAYPEGIDVTDGKQKNMFKAGIIDPTKVLRVALENAFSVALMGLTTNVLISEKYE